MYDEGDNKDNSEEQETEHDGEEDEEDNDSEEDDEVWNKIKRIAYSYSFRCYYVSML